MRKLITGAAFFIGGTIMMNNIVIGGIVGMVGILFALFGAVLLINETWDPRDN